MSAVEPITAATLPAPRGHYAHATRWHELTFISGQLPFDPAGEPVGPAFADQARAAMTNLLAIVAAAGGTPADLLKITAYIVDVDHWPAFNTIYAELMGDAKPARAIVPVPALHYGFLVEVDGIAAIAPAGTD